jgi:hypothetical protein
MAASKPSFDAQVQDRLTACIDLIGRTGAHQVQIRYSDDEQPVVWFVVATYLRRRRGAPTRKAHETAAALTPDLAAFRLAETLVDGGQCQHCKRPTGVTADWATSQPLSELICWYVYDPELNTFRRGCE